MGDAVGDRRDRILQAVDPNSSAMLTEYLASLAKDLAKLPVSEQQDALRSLDALPAEGLTKAMNEADLLTHLTSHLSLLFPKDRPAPPSREKKADAAVGEEAGRPVSPEALKEAEGLLKEALRSEGETKALKLFEASQRFSVLSDLSDKRVQQLRSQLLAALRTSEEEREYAVELGSRLFYSFSDKEKELARSFLIKTMTFLIYFEDRRDPKTSKRMALVDRCLLQMKESEKAGGVFQKYETIEKSSVSGSVDELSLLLEEAAQGKAIRLDENGVLQSMRIAPLLPSLTSRGESQSLTAFLELLGEVESAAADQNLTSEERDRLRISFSTAKKKSSWFHSMARDYPAVKRRLDSFF